MDKYLIKKPREKPPALTKKSPEKKLVQSTIESMKGVVVVDDILRLKSKLILDNQSPAVLVECLTNLGHKTPGRDILRETGIGRIVNKLRKHPDTDVSATAHRLYSRWKECYTHRLTRPQIEVRYDRDTLAMRDRAKKFLSMSLLVEQSCDLVDCIEREIFHSCNKLLNVDYKRTVRYVTFALKNDSLRQTVVSGEMSVEDLILQYKKR